MTPLILDCNNICHIQRHALGRNLSHGDEQTGILWGFFGTMLRLAREFNTRRFLFCWDGKHSKLHRRKDYAGYKASRKKELTPAEQKTEQQFRGQFDVLREQLLPALGFRNIYWFPECEADDLIAKLVQDFEWEDLPVVVSTDKDLYQLLPLCNIHRPLSGAKKTLMTADAFQKEYGISCERWAEVKAMEGDAGDDIPGIPGVGTKTAIAFLNGDLKPTSKVYAKIISPESRKIILRNRRLVYVPHPDTPDLDVVKDVPIRQSEFVRMCKKYDFQSFLRPGALEEWTHHFRMR